MIARKLGLVAVAFFALAVLAGCRNPKLTFEHYQRIEVGMCPCGVEELLGDPWHKHAAYWQYEDEKRAISARIYFDPDGNEVTCKQWFNPEHGWQSDKLESPHFFDGIVPKRAPPAEG